MGSASDPRPLSQAISELILLRGFLRRESELQLSTVWSEVAGATIASSTKVLGIKNGVLQVGVSNAPLLGELASFHKFSLLEAIQQRYGQLKIRDLKFRLKGTLQSGK